VEKFIDALKSFGLSEYEARVILTLIAEGELTASEISGKSGVPRTSVYEVVKSLISRGIVEEISGKPMKFRALSSEDIMNLFARKVKDNIDFLKENLPSIRRADKVEEIVKFYRGEMAINLMKELIENAKRSVIVATMYLDEEIKNIVRLAKCNTVMLSINLEKDSFKAVKLEIEKSEWRHGVILVDDERVLIYMRYKGDFVIMSGSGTFAEFYRTLLHPYIKLKQGLKGEKPGLKDKNWNVDTTSD